MDINNIYIHNNSTFYAIFHAKTFNIFKVLYIVILYEKEKFQKIIKDKSIQ
jgi:hypothetical protein